MSIYFSCCRLIGDQTSEFDCHKILEFNDVVRIWSQSACFLTFLSVDRTDCKFFYLNCGSCAHYVWTFFWMLCLRLNTLSCQIESLLTMFDKWSEQLWSQFLDLLGLNFSQTPQLAPNSSDSEDGWSFYIDLAFHSLAVQSVSKTMIFEWS